MGITPTTSQTARGLGFADNWQAPNATFGYGGTFGGQKLPEAVNFGQMLGWANQPGADWSPQDIAFARQNAAHVQQTQPQNNAGQAGSPEWWAAVKAAQGG